MQNLISYLTAIGRGLIFWRKPPPIETMCDLVEFVATRATFIGQTTLFDYLRARAGLQHFNLLTDEVFLAMLRPARTRLILVCLDDLTIFTACLVGRLTDSGREDMQRLAVHLFRRAAMQIDAKDIPETECGEAVRGFETGAVSVDWMAHGGDGAFAKSLQALIDLAPVVDTLKQLDGAIVQNSMRFKWRGIEAELAQRLRAESVFVSFAAKPAKRVS